MVRCGGRLSCRDAMSLVEAHGDFYTATFSRHLHHQNPDKLQLVARILEERNSVAANLLRVNCLLQTMHRHDRWCRTTKETSTGTAVVSPAAVDNLQDPHQSVCGEHLLQVRMLLQPRWHFIVWHLIAPRNPCQASCINMLYVYCRCTEFCDAERCGVLRMLAQARSAIAYKPLHPSEMLQFLCAFDFFFARHLRRADVQRFVVHNVRYNGCFVPRMFCSCHALLLFSGEWEPYF